MDNFIFLTFDLEKGLTRGCVYEITIHIRHCNTVESNSHT